MATQITDSHGQIPQELIVDTDTLNTLRGDITGSSGTFYDVHIVNGRTNTAFVKLYDAATATVGTTAPDWIFQVPPGTTRSYSFPDGVTFTNLSYACVTSGGTAGTTSPSGGTTVILHIVTK